MDKNLAQHLRVDRISNLKLRPVCTVNLTDSIQDVVRKMIAHQTGCALVMDGNLLAGIFTERDFLNRVVARGIDPTRWVHEVMTTEPKTIDKHVTVMSAIQTMEQGNYRHLPVVGEDKRPIGVLSIRDIVHNLVEYFPSSPYNASPSFAEPQLARR